MSSNADVPVVWLSDEGLKSEKVRILSTLRVLDQLTQESSKKLEAVEIEMGMRNREREND